MIINHNDLSSFQDYTIRGIHGFKRMDEEPEPDGFLCDCGDPVDEEGGMCGVCQAEEDEYRQDQLEDR